MGERDFTQIFRTDTPATDYYYDGTRWLSKQLFSFEHYQAAISASSAALQRWGVWGGQDLWLENFHLSCLVQSGGTNLTPGTHLWTVGFHKTDAAADTFNIATRTINAHPTGTYDTWFTVASGTVNALLGVNTDKVEYTVVKTGTPGVIYVLPRLTYRRVG